MICCSQTCEHVSWERNKKANRIVELSPTVSLRSLSFAFSFISIILPQFRLSIRQNPSNYIRIDDGWSALKKYISEQLIIGRGEFLMAIKAEKGTWNDILSKTPVKDLVFKENKVKNTLLVLCAFNFSLLIFEEEKVSCCIWIKMQTLKASYRRTNDRFSKRENEQFVCFLGFFFFFSLYLDGYQGNLYRRLKKDIVIIITIYFYYFTTVLQFSVVLKMSKSYFSREIYIYWMEVK